MDYSTQFISADRDYSSFTHYVPAPYIRKSIEVNFTAEKAEMLVCGLGFYEFWLNGEHLTRGRLAPYISNPNDLLYYDRYDLTDKIREGKNTVAFILGNGMQNCFGGQIWDFEKARWRSAPKLALSLEINGKNGEKLLLEADESFKCAPSPIYYDDLRVGEFYDARNEIDGWNLPEFDDSDWSDAIAVDAPSGEFREGKHSIIIDEREIKPVKITDSRISCQPNVRKDLPKVTLPDDENAVEGKLYDFGENIAGRIRLKIKGKKGQKIIMQFSERLFDGGLDIEGMNFLPQGLDHRCIYICKGDGEEAYEPSFSFFGFRYCLVMGLDEEQATEDLLTYIVMHGDFETVGSFTCSDDTVNLLQAAARRSDLANMFYFPTDCPHREKNGWTGDAQLSAEQFLINFGMEDSLEEWLVNIRKAQNDLGALPGIVPTGGWGFEWGNGPAWDAVITELPYRIWQYRGNIKVLEDNAHAMLRYLSYLTTRVDEKGLIRIGLGDWCPVGDKCKSPLEFTDTAVSMDIANKAARMFKAINRPLWADFASGFAESLRNAIRTSLVDPETLEVAGNCQTSQAAAIYYGVFNESEKQKAFDVLLRLIRDADDHIDFGIIGARVLFHVLSEFGHDDLALKMITRRDYPSFGYWLEQGATSLFENFAADYKDALSNNHHFFGDISAWFFKNLVGIIPNPDFTDADSVVISPAFVTELNSASGSYNTPHGKVEVNWQRFDDKISLKIDTFGAVKGKILLRGDRKFTDGSNEIPLASGIYEIK